MTLNKLQMNFSFFKKRLSNPCFVLFLIGFCGLIIYSNIYHSPFTFDDTHSIVENKTIRNLSSYLSPSRLLKPRAVVNFTFALNYRYGKLNVFSYHLINVLVHILNGFLVYFLTLAILKQRPEFSNPTNHSVFESTKFAIKSIPLLSAMIFVAHPIQTQAVTYTVQRYASMAAMFYIGSILFYTYARRIQNKEADKIKNRFHISGFFALSIICGMLAFLSKQNTASLPGAILLVEYLIINGTWDNWKKKIPWFAITFVLWFLFVLYIVGLFSSDTGGKNLLEDVADLSRETETVSRWQYLCTQFNVLVIYIRLLFLPIGQNLDYMYAFKTGFFDGLTPLAFIILIAIGGFGIRNKKRHPVITFSIFFFFITLSIESSIIPIRDAIFEHRLYLPMFGFGLFVSYQLFHYLSSKRSLALVLSLSIIVSLGSATYFRNTIWQDNTNLWSDIVSKTSHNYRAHNNLGLTLKKQGQTEEAIEHYLQALQIKPDFEDAHNNLGNALKKQGQIEVAIEHYLQALRIKPDYEKAHNNLAIALFRKGNIEGAITHFRKVLRINPDHVHAKNNLKKVLMMQQQTR